MDDYQRKRLEAFRIICCGGTPPKETPFWEQEQKEVVNIDPGPKPLDPEFTTKQNPSNTLLVSIAPINPGGRVTISYPDGTKKTFPATDEFPIQPVYDSTKPHYISHTLPSGEQATHKYIPQPPTNLPVSDLPSSGGGTAEPAATTTPPIVYNPDFLPAHQYDIPGGATPIAPKDFIYLINFDHPPGSTWTVNGVPQLTIPITEGGWPKIPIRDGVNTIVHTMPDGTSATKTVTQTPTAPPERNTQMRTLDNWIVGNDHFPNVNNVPGNYYTWLTFENGHNQMNAIRQNLANPMPSCTTYIFKTSTAATTYRINFATAPNFPFTLDVTIDGEAKSISVPAGSPSAIIDYSTFTKVKPGLNEVTIVFNIPTVNTLSISNIVTNLPPEYAIVSKRLYVSKKVIWHFNGTQSSPAPDVPPENNWFKLDKSLKLLGNFDPVEFQVSKSAKNFGGIRILAGGWISSAPSNGASSLFVPKAYGSIGTQRQGMVNITQQATDSGSYWRFILSRGPGGQGTAFNSVQFIDNL